MNSEVRDALDARRKFAVLQYAEGIGNVKEACRDFNVPRSTLWERTDAAAAGLLLKVSPVSEDFSPRNPCRRFS